MSKKLSRQDTVEGAFGAMHKFSGLVGINSEKLENKVRRSRSTDVEKGKPVREEAKQILERALVKKSTDEEVEETEVPSLNQHHVKEILESMKEAEAKKTAPGVGLTLCQLSVFMPLAGYIIYVGYTNVENCPLARLPEWLIVFGVLSAIRGLCLVSACISGQMDSQTALGLTSYVDKTVTTVSAFWGLYGIYLLWGNWSDYTWEDTTSQRYCVYSVMIWSKILVGLTILGLIFLGIAVCCCCCGLGLTAVLS